MRKQPKFWTWHLLRQDLRITPHAQNGRLLQYSASMPAALATEPNSIKLPRVFGVRNLDGVFEVCQSVQNIRGAVTLDGSLMSFVDPLGIAVLGALLEPKRDERPVRLVWLSTDVGNYLERMEVLNRCGIEGVETNCVVKNDLAATLVELTRVSHEHEVDEAAARLATAVAGKLTTADPAGPKNEATGLTQFDSFRHPIRYALSELLLNALSHAKREGRSDAAVWVAAQYYKKEGEVQLGVVDNGCGFLSTLMNSPKLRTKTHLAAIPTALEPFVSCNPDRGDGSGTSNRGVGLTTTYRIAAATRGGLVIVSGNAAAIAERHVRTFTLKEGAYWDGVAILMKCRRAQLPTVNIPQLLPPIDNAPKISVNFAP